MFSNSKDQCKRSMGQMGWQGDCGEATSVTPAAHPVRWLRIQAGGNMPLKPPPIWETASVVHGEHGSPTGPTQLAARDPMPGDVLLFRWLKPWREQLRSCSGSWTPFPAGSMKYHVSVGCTHRHPTTSKRERRPQVFLRVPLSPCMSSLPSETQSYVDTTDLAHQTS